MTNPTQLLRDMLKENVTRFVPAAFDGLSARLIQRARFPFAFISGYGIAASRIGMPDVGLITGTEMADTVRHICSAVPGFPFIADGDQGYGNAMNVRRTVLDYARAGAAAIMIEDQAFPKRCGHFADKQVVPRAQARLKIRAAVDARRESGMDILIMARTDALGPYGFEEALARIIEFEQEGADLLFIEALETEQQMRTFCSAVQRPTCANHFAGGRSPFLARDTLSAIGFRVVIDPTLLFSAAHAMQLHLQSYATGHQSSIPPATPFREMSEILGFPDYAEVSKRYE